MAAGSVSAAVEVGPSVDDFEPEAPWQRPLGESKEGLQYLTSIVL